MLVAPGALRADEVGQDRRGPGQADEVLVVGAGEGALDEQAACEVEAVTRQRSGYVVVRLAQYVAGLGVGLGHGGFLIGG